MLRHCQLAKFSFAFTAKFTINLPFTTHMITPFPRKNEKYTGKKTMEYSKYCLLFFCLHNPNKNVNFVSLAPFRSLYLHPFHLSFIFLCEFAFSHTIYFHYTNPQKTLTFVYTFNVNFFKNKEKKNSQNYFSACSLEGI